MPENRDVRVCEAANTPAGCSSEKTVLRQQDEEASSRQVLLKVKDLEVTYGSGRKAFKAVNRANFEIYKGETFGLVGESGSGKTTIGRAIMRILPTSGGEILYKGQKINGKISRQLDQQVIKEIQMIFQDPQSSLNERAKVSYIVGEGLQNVRPDLTAAQREEKVRQALLDVGLLPEFASRFPHEFSGGQRQRIGIARALIVEPEFIIADEPISALDMSIRAQVLNLLRHLQKERGITYLFIAHDLSVMRYISDRIAVIHKGNIVELADAEELVTHSTPTPAACAPPSPSPPPGWSGRKSCWSTTPPCTITRRKLPSGGSCAPATGCSAASRRPKTGWLKCKLSLAFFGKVRPLFLDISTLLYYNSSCTYCVVFNKRTKFKTPLNLAAPAAGAVTAQRTKDNL